MSTNHAKSAAALGTFILAMVLNPDVQRKAQKEIDSLIGKERLPEFEDEEQLPYTTAILREVLRFVPLYLQRTICSWKSQVEACRASWYDTYCISFSGAELRLSQVFLADSRRMTSIRDMISLRVRSSSATSGT